MNSALLLVCALVITSFLNVRFQATQQNAAAAPVAAVQPSATTPAAAVSTGPISTKIVPGSRVYITPIEGFENYLAAALGKKKVPLVPVADKEHADYVITGTSLRQESRVGKDSFHGKHSF